MRSMAVSLSQRIPVPAASEFFMRESPEKSPKAGGIDPQALNAHLRRRHPVKTAACVAAAIGASERTVEKWLEGASLPSAGWFCRLIAAYGPEFLAAALPGALGWLSAARRLERLAALEAEQARVGLEIKKLRNH